jgi:hypothetical protein
MRLVKHMDDRFYKDLINELEESFHNLGWKFNHYSAGDFPRPARYREGDQEFPFPLAAELWHIYRYLTGQAPAPDFMLETLQNVCDLVWYNPFLHKSEYHIEWEAWERTKLGFFVRCSFIAIALEAGDSINSKQLSLLAGITPTAVIKQIKEGKLRAIKEDREWVIEAEDALKFLETQFQGAFH